MLRARQGPEMAPAFIVIDGKRYPWKEILKLRREQRKAARQPQLTLFELKEEAARLVSGRLNVATWSQCSLARLAFGANRPTGSGEGQRPGSGRMRRPIPNDPQGADGNQPRLACKRGCFSAELLSVLSWLVSGANADVVNCKIG